MVLQLRCLYVVVILLALVTAGCTGKPEEQIKLAENAMEQAKAQRAEEFSPDQWKLGQEAWSEANAAIEKGEYGRASTRLLTVKTRFEKARDIAKGRREALLREVQGLQKTVDLRYQSLRNNIQTEKLSPKTRKELEESCAEIDKSIEKIKAEVSEGEYSQANITAQTTMHQVYGAEKKLKGIDGKRP